MKIGIDLDDTICRTSEIVHDRLESYSEKLGFNPLDIMNDDNLKYQFFSKYIEDIYKNVEIKREVSNVLKRLKSKGNQIIIITARSGIGNTSDEKIIEITNNWLIEHDIKIDKLIINSYGDNKAKACKNNNIDLMIEDDPFNYKKIISCGINCLLFDDREKYDLGKNYVTNWLDIERYIERNR